MPWTITYRDKEPEDYKIGDMWPALGWANSNMLSNKYKNEAAGKRPPLMVILPSIHSEYGDRFIVDRGASDDPDNKGWDVVIVGELKDGETPDITLSPSINCVGSYHGYIRNGIITDDCEGRTYKSPQ